jgi:cell division protease FtsH
MDRKKILRNPLLWVVAGLLLYYAFGFLLDDTRGYSQVTTSQALQQLSSHNVKQATIEDKEQRLRLTLDHSVPGIHGTKVLTQYPAQSTDQITQALRESPIPDGWNTTVTQQSLLFQVLIYLIPLGLLLLLLMWMMNNVQGGGNRVLNFGKSKAKQLSKDMPKTTFGDVAGADEAVEELEEIKDFLANPSRYQALGAKIPKGVLLYGPPGTGKTLLARAVAGEASVPFFSMTGSGFIELYVGVGASRVRDLFAEARKRAPSIIFIDEIDAIGQRRGSGFTSNDEREQTLNQLLAEMDGFDPATGVVVMAATNRPETLDPALLRPGRFDRQVVVPLPTQPERRAILAVHARGKHLAADVDLDAAARATPGFSGADLANLLNEAAIVAVRDGRSEITAVDLSSARDRILLGPRQGANFLLESERRNVAVHESGHALVAALSPHADPVDKVTILPSGMALGVTEQVPEEERHLYSEEQLRTSLAVRLGGRAAELVVFEEGSTGASNDLSGATDLATRMVREFGLSPALGPVGYSGDSPQFLGSEQLTNRTYSEETQRVIDTEVSRLLREAEAYAVDLLRSNRGALDALTQQLLEHETVSGDVVRAVAEGRTPAAAVR